MKRSYFFTKPRDVLESLSFTINHISTIESRFGVVCLEIISSLHKNRQIWHHIYTTIIDLLQSRYDLDAKRVT